MTRPREEASPVRLPRLLVVALIAAILVILLTFASILIGSKPLGLTEIMALVSGSGSEEVRTLVGEVRLPRTLAGMLVGAALACGALMQAMTRNPSQTRDCSASGQAAFAVTIGMSWLGLRSAFGIAASAIIGAAAVTTVVLILGLRGRADGSRLILAGVALSMTVSGIQSAITLLNPRALDAMRAWSAGSLASPDSKVIAFRSRYWPSAR